MSFYFCSLTIWFNINQIVGIIVFKTYLAKLMQGNIVLYFIWAKLIMKFLINARSISKLICPKDLSLLRILKLVHDFSIMVYILHAYLPLYKILV